MVAVFGGSSAGAGRSRGIAGVVGVDEEATLVRRAQALDEGAFVELVTANRGAVWAVCLPITGNPHDAEDAVQDTLVAAWRNIARFRSESSFSTWPFRIASNAALAVVPVMAVI